MISGEVAAIRYASGAFVRAEVTLWRSGEPTGIERRDLEPIEAFISNASWGGFLEPEMGDDVPTGRALLSFLGDNAPALEVEIGQTIDTDRRIVPIRGSGRAPQSLL